VTDLSTWVSLVAVVVSLAAVRLSVLSGRKMREAERTLRETWAVLDRVGGSAGLNRFKEVGCDAY